jgi:hypothetical protein
VCSRGVRSVSVRCYSVCVFAVSTKVGLNTSNVVVGAQSVQGVDREVAGAKTFRSAELCAFRRRGGLWNVTRCVEVKCDAVEGTDGGGDAVYGAAELTLAAASRTRQDAESW